MSRRRVLSEAQWEAIEPLLPAQRPWSGRPRRDHRQVVEGIIYRYRCGIAWRDLPSDFRALADGVETPPRLVRRRHLGPHP